MAQYLIEKTIECVSNPHKIFIENISKYNIKLILVNLFFKSFVKSMWAYDSQIVDKAKTSNLQKF